MSDYEKAEQVLKKNLFRFKKNQRLYIKGLFLLRVIQAKKAGRPIYIECEKRGQNAKYFYFWFKRFKAHNWALESLEGYSKRPKHSPGELPRDIIKRAEVLRGKDGLGGHKVAAMLRNEGVAANGSTICAHFRKNGISKVYRFRKQNNHQKRYAAENPLDRAQTDSAWSGFEDNHGNRLYFFPVIDDCARVATVYVADTKASTEACLALEKFIKKFGFPGIIQTDNGTEFTTKYISEQNPRRSKPAKISAFEEYTQSQGIRHYLIRIRTPQLNGKVERFNQTIKRAMRNRLYDGITLTEARQIVDEWVEYYNRKIPHTSLKMLTPYEKFYGVRYAKLA